jgi:hypothetical protein
VFAFDDDFAFGLLSSAAHLAWAERWKSTIKGDPRYTPTSVFATFPWPCPVADVQRDEVSAVAAELSNLRTKLTTEEGIGLTELYNTMDAGGYRELAALHGRLDRAVLACYGWPESIAQNPAELVAHLAGRNAAIVAGADYVPFAPLPKSAPEPPAELPF